jgi:hypothetical protein
MKVQAGRAFSGTFGWKRPPRLAFAVLVAKFATRLEVPATPSQRLHEEHGSKLYKQARLRHALPVIIRQHFKGE